MKNLRSTLIKTGIVVAIAGVLALVSKVKMDAAKKAILEDAVEDGDIEEEKEDSQLQEVEDMINELVEKGVAKQKEAIVKEVTESVKKELTLEVKDIMSNLGADIAKEYAELKIKINDIKTDKIKEEV